MSDYYYSFKEKGFFYKPDTESGDCPTDLIPLTDEHYHELMQGQADGKCIEHRKDGPVLVNYPALSLEDARKQKYAEINAWRDAQENADYTFKFKEHTWDYGKASQARLQPVAALAKNGQLPDGFFWTDAHNHDVPMTAGEVLELESAMVGAMVAKGFEIHQHQRNLKEALAKLTTAEDVLAFKVE